MKPKPHQFEAPEAPHGLLIFGFGGHARVVADIALALGVSQFCFVDEQARQGETFLGYPVVKVWDQALPKGWQVFCAAGDAARRQLQYDHAAALGCSLATLIAPDATIGIGATIGTGSLIARHAHVGPMATIGVGCIINTGAIVEHESAVGDFSHISVHATVAGRSRVGRHTMIGAGATVIDGIEIGDHITLGAGGVAHASLMEAGIYVGVPALRTKP